jgi:hypothetical protein
VPVLTADRKEDPILYTALVADADLLIADDSTSCRTAMKSFGGTTIAW